MLEQQDSSTGDGGGVTVVVTDFKHGCGGDRGGGSASSENVDGEIENGEVSGNQDCDGGGEDGKGSRNSDGDVSNQNDNSRGDSVSPTTESNATTVRIHTTYKKRASKFMNRPNVQNGLGPNPLLNPYGGNSNGGFGAPAGSGGSGGRLFSNKYSFGSGGSLNNHNTTNSVSSLIGGGIRHNRSLTTRNSIFGGGSGSSGGGYTSPHSQHNGTSATATTASSTTATTVETRPPFVTTVTRGRFLPSKFDLMVEKSLFTFSSRPKPVGLITKHHCALSGPNPLKENNSQNYQPRGAHDYFNVMWDPHVYRGTTTTLTSSLKQPDASDISSSNRDQQDRYRRRRAFLQGSQNTFNSSTTNLPPMGGLGGGNHTTTIRSNRYRMTSKITSRSRTFPPPEGRHQVHVQTEEYLEDLSRDVIRGSDVDAVVQTDPIEDEQLLFSPLANTADGTSGGADKRKRLPFAAGVDASTQILPGELITFDEQIQPVVEAVVGKILEQALLETMEEEEIGALKAQQNRFLEKRKEEERELKRLQEQQERISAEKERLKRYLEIQIKQRQLQPQEQNRDTGGDYVEGGEGDVPTAMRETTGGNGSNINGVLSTAYLLELLPSVLNSLRQEGFLLEDQSGEDALSSYVPLWQHNNMALTAEGDNTSTNENNYEDNVMNVDDGENFTTYPDGCQSRMNSLEIVAANPADLPDQQPESISSEPMEGVAEVVQDANENYDEASEEANVEEMPTTDTLKKDENEEDETEETELETVVVEAENDSTSNDQEGAQEMAAEDFGELNRESGEVVDNEDVEESIEQQVENDTEASPVTPSGEDDEPEEGVNDIDDKDAGLETSENVAIEDESLDTSPSIRPPSSSSMKLPNGAIPNML